MSRISQDEWDRCAAAVGIEWEAPVAQALAEAPARCLTCGHRWEPSASNVTKGHGCPVCAGSVPVSPDEWDRRGGAVGIVWEAIIVALIGGAVGLVLGIFLGIVVVERVPSLTTLSVPWTSLVILLVLAAVAGAIAAIFPARRAARLDVLKAIQTD